MISKRLGDDRSRREAFAAIMKSREPIRWEAHSGGGSGRDGGGGGGGGGGGAPQRETTSSRPPPKMNHRVDDRRQFQPPPAGGTPPSPPFPLPLVKRFEDLVKTLSTDNDTVTTAPATIAEDEMTTSTWQTRQDVGSSFDQAHPQLDVANTLSSSWSFATARGLSDGEISGTHSTDGMDTAQMELAASASFGAVGSRRASASEQGRPRGPYVEKPGPEDDDDVGGGGAAAAVPEEDVAADRRARAMRRMYNPRPSSGGGGRRHRGYLGSGTSSNLGPSTSDESSGSDDVDRSREISLFDDLSDCSDDNNEESDNVGGKAGDGSERRDDSSTGWYQRLMDHPDREPPVLRVEEFSMSSLTGRKGGRKSDGGGGSDGNAVDAVALRSGREESIHEQFLRSAEKLERKKQQRQAQEKSPVHCDGASSFWSTLTACNFTEQVSLKW